MALEKKDLLEIQSLSLNEINLILTEAASFKEIMTRPRKIVPALVGKTVVILFYEPSTRTRTSFEIAAKMLSANVLNISVSTSSVKKGEALIDTIKNIETMGADAIIMRHEASGAAHLAAEYAKVSIINAGDGSHEHPTQTLLDLYTLKEKLRSLKGKRILIIGDISHSRVARSNIWGFTKMGAEVTVCGPPTLIPQEIEKMGVTVSYTLDKVLAKSDVIYVLRLQLERQKKGLFPSLKEYINLYGINKERLVKAPGHCIVMHPGPVNRGIELSSEVVDGLYNVILEQVENGIAVRAAVLFLLLGRK